MMNYRDMRTSQTLLRGLKLLELIATGKSDRSIRELADEVKLSRSIVHRLLSTLEEAGYIRRNLTTPGYSLRTKLWSLGCASIQDLEIREVARPSLEDLSSKTKELVSIAILDRKDVLYIDKIDCPQSLRAYIPIGGRAPAYCVATGKAMLAHLDENELAKAVPSMTKYTQKTIIGLKALKRHLQEIRKTGYSVNSGEYHLDVGGVAAPIFSEAGVQGAIGVTLPMSRLTRAAVSHIGLLTIEAAATISQALGYEFKKQTSSRIA